MDHPVPHPPAASEFVFEINEVYEIIGDPGGHYRHWTYFTGKLIAGVVHDGERIKIPTTLGAVPAQILGFDLFGKNLGTSITADSMAESFLLATRCPALRKSQVVAEFATEIDERSAVELALQLLDTHPSVYLHHVARDGRKYPRLCRQCARALSKSPDLKSRVETLVDGDDLKIAELAKEFLGLSK